MHRKLFFSKNLLRKVQFEGIDGSLLGSSTRGN